MNIDFIEAVEALQRERGIPKEALFEAIESALVSAYKKNYNDAQNVRISIDQESGAVYVFMRRDIVEEVEDPFSQCSLEEAQSIDPDYELGDVIEYMVNPQGFGRIAAQSAKQVVMQKIRETERGMIFDEFIARQGEIVTGTVQRVSNDTVFVTMGRAEGILSKNEQIPGERYRYNDRIKVFVMDVKKTTKGPQVFLSRSHPGLVKRLFELEVPEIQEGVVEIKSIAREAGSRTKIAVCTYDENVDPVGSCVGTRGTRVQAVVDELSGEKIDIINWSEEPGKLISSALSPAKVEMVLIDEVGKSATAVVPDYQLSLAIGKEGQNVRLAAKLCGWKIDIKSRTQYQPTLDAMSAAAEGDFAEDEDFACEYDEVSELDIPTPSKIKRMKKAELVEFAEKMEIDLDPTATNAVMADTIIAALEERGL